MQDITLPSITPQSATEAEATFVVEPLYPGYGTTVGTALRRVLLSSLPGAAITSVRITGVDHEFSTVSGVKEDVIEIILNLKQVRFRLEGDDPVTVSLTSSGPGTITAGDITPTDRLTIVNPKQYIAALADKKSKFDAELTIEKGRGYLPVERREEQKLPVGTIAIDAVFTPVTRVNFSVENTRVGQMTNFDRLLLKVATDQTVTPEEALKQAAGTLVSQFELFTDPEAHRARADAGRARTPELLIEDAELSARTTNALLNNDFKTLQDVANVPESDLSSLKGFGKKAVDEVREKLAELGLGASTEEPPAA
jgi:DNA-directed RNA polymerase subunit alpha